MKANRVLIIGGGGHAKVLIDSMLIGTVEVIGIVDEDRSKAGKYVLGIPVIGTEDVLADFCPETVWLVNGLGSIELPEKRTELYLGMKKRGYSFLNIIHPAAIVSSDVTFGEGVQIMAGAVVQPGVHLSDNVILNTNSSVDHDCQVGCHSHIAPGVTLSGNIMIGEGVHIGTGTSVVQGVHIGSASVVGAGSLVLADVNPGETVYGSPARVVSK